MARRNHLDDFTRGRMIGKLEEGRTVTSVAAEFGINKSVNSRAWKVSQTTGTAVRMVGDGRPRTTTAGDNRYIILLSKRDRRQSASVIAQQLSTATGRQVAQFIVARRLHKGGLFARSPERDLPLKVYYRRHRLQWCREHKNLTTNNGVVSSLRIRERHNYGVPGVLVWDGIKLNGRTQLLIFDRGSVTGDRYCEEVLLPHVRLFRGVIGPDFIFMDDNARPHRTLAVDDLLESEDITRMDWPTYSPDLNPIKQVGDAMGRHIAAHLHHPENTQQLKEMLIEEWALLPQEMLHQLVLSMRIRKYGILRGAWEIAPKMEVGTYIISLLRPLRHTYSSPDVAKINGKRKSSKFSDAGVATEFRTCDSMSQRRINGGFTSHF
ncbi:transposable element Tcb2 transposase [Trichonephila clavipes]|nr:transposable element Tcb2 transposase [Trichonephila clavipes]